MQTHGYEQQKHRSDGKKVDLTNQYIKRHFTEVADQSLLKNRYLKLFFKFQIEFIRI